MRILELGVGTQKIHMIWSFAYMIGYFQML